jgi:mannose-6-phosphate isomerase-like protein (cupin superfamily)
MKVYKPWGWYETIVSGTLPNGEQYWVKILSFNPGQALSLQSHECRDEIWKLVKGEGEVTINNYGWGAKEGTVVHITRGTKHRARCTGAEPLIILEIAYGTICDEDDLTRYEDDYGRK